MISYNNISRPVHDPLRPPVTSRPPCPKSEGRDPQPPRIDAPALMRDYVIYEESMGSIPRLRWLGLLILLIHVAYIALVLHARPI